MRIKLPPIKYAIRRTRQLESGYGFTTDIVGYESVELVADIDERALAAALGHKAARNKSGKACLQGDAVEVRVVSRSKISEAA